MATTIGQHSVASFTSPVNGTTPIDANSVRGNDNTLRVAYVDHDADPGIHVQSSTLASRPAAGTAGRKWITEDSGIYTLWFDDGVHWHPVSSEAVAITVLATENLVKGDVVKVVGWNNGQDLAEVAKTTSASDVAFAVITATVSSGVLGYATNTGVLQDINTNAYAVGTVLYPNASGGFTSTKPTSGNYQPVAYVLRQNTNNGVIYVEFSAPRIVERSDNTASTIVLRDSNGDFSAGTITATAVNATTLDLTNLEVTNIKAKDGTQAIAIADSTGATTFSANVTATLATAAQPNVTSVGTLSSLTVSGDLTVDTSTLKVDSANNRVGVGTATPAYNVQVSGASPVLNLNGTGTTGTTLFSTISGGTNGVTAIQSYNGGILAFDTGSTGAGQTERMRIDASGRLSVNTTSATGYLTVDTKAQFGLDIFRSDSSAQYSAIRFRDTTNSNTYGQLGWDSTGLRLDGVAGTMYFSTSGTERMRLDASGNLGIGTASPATALHTYASGTVISQVETGTQYAITRLKNPTHSSDIGVDNTSLYMDSGGAYPIIFYTGSVSTERMRLDAGGSLGLGVTPSAWQTASYAVLELPVGGHLITDKNGNNLQLGANFFLNSSFQAIYKTNGAAASYNQDSGAHKWNTAPSGTAGNVITFGDPKMTLDASGNLIVGDTSADYSSTGRGLIEVNGSSEAFYAFKTGGAGRAYLAHTGTNLVVMNSSNGSIEFSTNSTERARITSGGFFKASNTGTYLNATGAYHELKSNDTSYVARIDNSHPSSPDGAIISFSGASPDNNTEYFLLCTDTTADRCYIYSDGDLANHDGVYGTISDERLKQDIVDASSQWDDLKAVRFRKYRMKTDVEAQGDDAPYLLGVVAQELEQTSPGLVDEHPNFEEQEVTDEDGNVTTERVQVGTTKTVKSSILLMKAAVALQEAMARIESLEARLAALES